MVRVVDCHAGVLGSNPDGPRIFSPWNYFIPRHLNKTAQSDTHLRYTISMFVYVKQYQREKKESDFIFSIDNLYFFAVKNTNFIFRG